MHLGGDEVDTSCWDKTQRIVDWMKKNNFDSKKTYEYFVKRTQDIAKKFGKVVINWNEVYDNFKDTLDKNTVIHEWNNSNSLIDATSKGFKAL